MAGILPDEASAIRPVGAILADLHDERQVTDRRYLSEDSMSLLHPERDTLTTAEPAVGNRHRDPTPKPHHATGRPPSIFRLLGEDHRYAADTTGLSPANPQVMAGWFRAIAIDAANGRQLPPSRRSVRIICETDARGGPWHLTN